MDEMTRSRHTLPSFPRLRYLQIVLNAGRDNSDAGCRFSMPSFIPRFFTAMISKHRQESLEILDFTARWMMERITPDAPEQDYESSPLIDRNRGWKEVDDVLSNRDLFPKLHAVRVACAPAIQGMGWDYEEPLPSQRVPDQVQHEAAVALHQTRNTTAIVYTGADGAEARRVEELLDSILPERYIPTGRFQKAVSRWPSNQW